MSAEDTIRILLGRGGEQREPLEAAAWKQVAARAAWLREACAEWREAMRRRDERCSAAVERLNERAFQRLYDAEQAKVDAIRARIDAVTEQVARAQRQGPEG